MAKEKKASRNEHQCALLREVYPALIFVALYMLNFYLFYILHLTSSIPASYHDVITFITSPFNYTEAVSYPPANNGGVFGNFVIVAIVMLISAVCGVFSYTWKQYHLTNSAVFGASILATYVVSLGLRIFNGRFEVGTSIIGFTFIILFAVTSLLGAIHLWRTNNEDGQIPKWPKLAIFAVVCLLTSWLALVLYIIGNTSYLSHLAGGATSGLVLIVWSNIHSTASPERVLRNE
jgi:hypothetical protein